MTDIEKFKQLLDSFGITYGITSDNKYTTILLTEDFYMLAMSDNFKVTVPACSKGNEVESYMGFYTSWIFVTETGKFNSVGIFE